MTGEDVDISPEAVERWAALYDTYGERDDPLVAATLRALAARVAELKRKNDATYEERNRVVALLASLFPAVRCKTSIDGWLDDWHGCVYISLPTGQVSWHYHDSQAQLFAHVPEGSITWDGHSTEEKYQRILAACASFAPNAFTRLIADAERRGMERAAGIARQRDEEGCTVWPDGEDIADEIEAAIRDHAKQETSS